MTGNRDVLLRNINPKKRGGYRDDETDVQTHTSMTIMNHSICVYMLSSNFIHTTTFAPHRDKMKEREKSDESRGKG